MATAPPPPAAPPPEDDAKTELEELAFADDKPFDRCNGQDHDNDQDGVTMDSDILVEGEELTDTLLVTEKQEKELIHNLFELLEMICNTQTVKLGPHGMDQLYLATAEVTKLQEELLHRPYTANTTRIVAALNALCNQWRGRTGQGFVRLSSGLAKITEFSAMDTIILTMFSQKLINTLPIPAYRESDYPTEVHEVDDSIRVLRDTFAIRLANHLRVTEWKCSDVSLKKTFSNSSKPLIADFLAQTTTCIYAICYQDARKTNKGTALLLKHIYTWVACLRFVHRLTPEDRPETLWFSTAILDDMHQNQMYMNQEDAVCFYQPSETSFPTLDHYKRNVGDATNAAKGWSERFLPESQRVGKTRLKWDKPPPDVKDLGDDKDWASYHSFQNNRSTYIGGKTHQQMVAAVGAGIVKDLIIKDKFTALCSSVPNGVGHQFPADSSLSTEQSTLDKLGKDNQGNRCFLLFNREPTLATVNLWRTVDEYFEYLKREHDESVTTWNTWKANDDARLSELEGRRCPVQPVRAPLPPRPKKGAHPSKDQYAAKLDEWNGLKKAADAELATATEEYKKKLAEWRRLSKKVPEPKILPEPAATQDKQDMVQVTMHCMVTGKAKDIWIPEDKFKRDLVPMADLYTKMTVPNIADDTPMTVDLGDTIFIQRNENGSTMYLAGIFCGVLQENREEPGEQWSILMRTTFTHQKTKRNIASEHRDLATFPVGKYQSGGVVPYGPKYVGFSKVFGTQRRVNNDGHIIGTNTIDIYNSLLIARDTTNAQSEFRILKRDVRPATPAYVMLNGLYIPSQAAARLDRGKPKKKKARRPSNASSCSPPVTKKITQATFLDIPHATTKVDGVEAVHIQEVWVNDFVDKQDGDNSYRQMLVSGELTFPRVDKALKFIKLDLRDDIRPALASAWAKTYKSDFTEELKVASVKAIKMTATRLRSVIKTNTKDIRIHKKFHHEEREVLPALADLPTHSRGYTDAQKKKAAATTKQAAQAQQHFQNLPKAAPLPVQPGPPIKAAVVQPKKAFRKAWLDVEYCLDNAKDADTVNNDVDLKIVGQTAFQIAQHCASKDWVETHTMELTTDEEREKVKVFQFGEAVKKVLRLGGVKLDKQFLMEVYPQHFSVRNFVCNMFIIMFELHKLLINMWRMQVAMPSPYNRGNLAASPGYIDPTQMPMQQAQWIGMGRDWERRRSHAELRGAVLTEQDRSGSTKKRRKRSRGSTDGPRASGKRSRGGKRARSASATKSDGESSAAEKESEQEHEATVAEGSQEESDADEDGSGEEPESEDQ